MPCRRPRQSDGGSRWTRGKMSVKVAESASSRASIRDLVEKDFLLAFFLHSYHSTLSLSPFLSLVSSSSFSHPSIRSRLLRARLSSSLRYIIFSCNSIIVPVTTRAINSRKKFEKFQQYFAKKTKSDLLNNL